MPGGGRPRRWSGLDERREVHRQIPVAAHLTMQAISRLRTIAKVAEMLGEDEEWPWDLSGDMFAEDGCITVYDLTEDGTVAFTELGLENLQERIRHHREWGLAPRPEKGGEA